MTPSLHGRLLSAAAALLGGSARLGHELQVPARDLQRWMAGKEPMPRAVFLKLVDLVSTPLSCSGDVRRKDQHLKGGERDAR